ncbi:APC family permease [Lactobacillus sp. ESL0731]|uniref:APC family permease n=1 Tax=unclassified Lactobacillus TaxID=2620435 RepID=UPI0023F7DF83|nr:MULTISPECIES: APC family permease [unclassified Lactobacillus]WEV50701.1 APC family permease [Lactobacillus sp. ESL0700]WEV61831.1 APC family permease [Lactobacillus sp. ESL0731]
MSKHKQASDKLGFIAIVFLTINLIIGSGIFLTPGTVVRQVGSKSLLVYLLAAVFAAVLALPFASASKYVNKSGSSYAYAKAAFGDKFGFYIGITCYFANDAVWCTSSVGIVKAIIAILGGNPNRFMSITAGLLLLMLLNLIINLFGQRITKYVMNLSTVCKTLSLVVLIVAGAIILMTTGSNYDLSAVDRIRESGKVIVPTVTVSTFMMAVVSALYAFSGFEAVASGAEDMEEPEKNLPRAIPLAVILIAFIYIGVLAVAMLLNPSALMKTNQVVALATIFANPLLNNIVLAGALISMLGINFAYSFSAPRFLEAMAREHQLSTHLTKRTKRNFPIRTFFISAAITTLIPMAFQYDLTNLVTLGSIVRFLEFAVVPIAVIQFYRGHNKGEILPANKNLLTDVVASVLSVIIVLFMLVEYNWRVQFGIIVNGQVVGINWYAILAVGFGFVILPLLMYLISRREWQDAE